MHGLRSRFDPTHSTPFHHSADGLFPARRRPGLWRFTHATITCWLTQNPWIVEIHGFFETKLGASWAVGSASTSPGERVVGSFQFTYPMLKRLCLLKVSRGLSEIVSTLPGPEIIV